MHPLVDPVTPAVELVLEVEVIREPAARHEVRAHEPVRALQDPLRLRIGRLQDHPANPELPAESHEVRRRAAVTGDRALPIPHQLLRQHPDPAEAAAEAPQDVRHLLREHQDARHQPGQAQLRRHHIPAALLPVTDRDQVPGLPQIALHQLTRPIDRPLKGATHLKPRTDLANVVIKDRLATLIAELGRHLPQPQRLNRRISSQLLADPLSERIQLRPRRRPHIPRRRVRYQRPRHGVTRQPQRLRDLPLRTPLDQHQPPDLSPLLHADHTLLLARSNRSSEGQDPAGRSQPHTRWVTFQPAQMEQYSTGAHNWTKRGRPRATNEPLEPSPLQLELDTTGRG